ncbi:MULTISPECIES: acyl-CoA thioesterase [Alicyclobacillus]|uniref:Acyl-CoA thioester hydrolase n=1 Tax=Alicyclobacillus vulcanalis TaxID=252246 RepID=A0A1N7LL43_9BACL|nr:MULTISPECIES: thioesterase family protein [Alicyclobacillus]SIS74499.1 acyl-CoA thioester hydrolase [Alicyclobacillus vulcanalis]
MRIFRTRDRVAFGDTDASGILHFAAPLRYLEVGEREAMRTLGVRVGDFRRGGYELPRVRLTCEYHHPLYYDDEIEVLTRCERIGRSSINWRFEIYRGSVVCVTAEMTVVLVDSVTRRPLPIPDEWRAHLLGEH